MALLVDSIAHLDKSVRRKFKKLFEELSNEFSVRSPMLEKLRIASLIIEGPNNSWLLVGYFKSNPERDALLKFFNFNDYLAKYSMEPMRYLLLSDTGSTMFDDVGLNSDNITLLDCKSFFAKGASIIKDNLTSYPKERSDAIKKKLFPESYINPVCILKRPKVNHDNSARIPHQFLDIDQEMVIKLDLREDSQDTFHEHEGDDMNVRLVNGVAGSGKTLILINRALFCCRKYPEQRVLMLIHNNPIVEEVKHKISQYPEGIPDNLEIITFHKYARRLNKEIFGNTHVEYDERKIRERLAKNQLLSKQNQFFYQLFLSPAQLTSEFEFICDFLIDSEEAYLETERVGRGFPLNKGQRQNVWKLYLLARELLTNRSYIYWACMMLKEMCLYDKLDDYIQQYEHILIDEAQFFAPSWLYLVKKSLAPSGKLFICADPNQGFLKSRLSWKSLGLNVLGRTKKLKHSYRTTYEILIAANKLLELLDEDSEDFVKPSYENMEHGDKPLVIYSGSPQDEIKRLANELRVILQGDMIATENIIILCSDSHKTYKVKDELEKSLGEACFVNCSSSRELKSGFKGKIRIMTINSCTGVEGILTFVLGVGDLVQKAKDLELNDDERKVMFHESMRKLYVAMTRASQRLVLFSTVPLPDEVSEFITMESNKGDKM